MRPSRIRALIKAQRYYTALALNKANSVILSAPHRLFSSRATVPLIHCHSKMFCTRYTVPFPTGDEVMLTSQKNVTGAEKTPAYISIME
jgi:hypothetical protein